MTHFVEIVISSRSFGLAQFFILLVFIYLHVIACLVLFLLVLNDIDHMKAWHTFSGCAGNLETFISCAAEYWLSVFLNDTRNPKGPCEFISFPFFFSPYTALPKRSALFVREAWVGVAFFFSHVVALLGEVGGEYLEGVRQKCRVDSAALFACLPLYIRVGRIRREPLTLRSPVPLAIFLTPNLIAAS